MLILKESKENLVPLDQATINFAYGSVTVLPTVSKERVEEPDFGTPRCVLWADIVRGKTNVVQHNKDDLERLTLKTVLP